MSGPSSSNTGGAQRAPRSSKQLDTKTFRRMVERSGEAAERQNIGKMFETSVDMDIKILQTIRSLPPDSMFSEKIVADRKRQVAIVLHKIAAKYGGPASTIKELHAKLLAVTKEEVMDLEYIESIFEKTDGAQESAVAGNKQEEQSENADDTSGETGQHSSSGSPAQQPGTSPQPSEASPLSNIPPAELTTMDLIQARIQALTVDPPKQEPLSSYKQMPRTKKDKNQVKPQEEPAPPEVVTIRISSITLQYYFEEKKFIMTAGTLGSDGEIKEFSREWLGIDDRCKLELRNMLGGIAMQPKSLIQKFHIISEPEDGFLEEILDGIPQFFVESYYCTTLRECHLMQFIPGVLKKIVVTGAMDDYKEVQQMDQWLQADTLIGSKTCYVERFSDVSHFNFAICSTKLEMWKTDMLKDELLKNSNFREIKIRTPINVDDPYHIYFCGAKTREAMAQPSWTKFRYPGDQKMDLRGCWYRGVVWFKGPKFVPGESREAEKEVTREDEPEEDMDAILKEVLKDSDLLNKIRSARIERERAAETETRRKVK